MNDPDSGHLEEAYDCVPSYRYVIGDNRYKAQDAVDECKEKAVAVGSSEGGVQSSRSFSPINTPRSTQTATYDSCKSLSSVSLPQQQQTHSASSGVAADPYPLPGDHHSWGGDSEFSAVIHPQHQHPPHSQPTMGLIYHGEQPHGYDFYGGAQSTTSTSASTPATASTYPALPNVIPASHSDGSSSAPELHIPIPPHVEQHRASKKSPGRRPTGRPRGRPKGSVKMGRPKRPLSAYNLFFKEERERILKGLPKTATDIAASPTVSTEKAILETREAEEEGEQARGDVAGGGAKAKRDSAGEPDKEGGPADDDCLEVSETSPTSSGKKRGRPRGPNYSEKKTPHGKVSFEQLAKIIGPKWKNIDPEVLARYQAIAKEEKIRYQKELEIFEEKAKAKKEAQEEQERQKIAHGGQPKQMITLPLQQSRQHHQQQAFVETVASYDSAGNWHHQSLPSHPQSYPQEVSPVINEAQQQHPSHEWHHEQQLQAQFAMQHHGEWSQAHQGHGLRASCPESPHQHSHWQQQNGPVAEGEQQWNHPGHPQSIGRWQVNAEAIPPSPSGHEQQYKNDGAAASTDNSRHSSEATRGDNYSYEYYPPVVSGL